MGRWLLLGGLLAAAFAAAGQAPAPAFACHPDRLFDTRVNLDGDAAKERVTALDSHNCAHTEFEAYVHVRDRCRGTWRTYDLQSEGDVLRQFRIVNADARTRRPEVFFVTQRLGPVARGIAEVVRLDDRASGCARVRALFRYVPSDPAVQSFDVQLTNAAPQFPGLEITLTESREVAQRITRYRYDRTRDRYVVYG
jgi:sarcosine oxidase delta subunit